jgi:hypothetical protein
LLISSFLREIGLFCVLDIVDIYIDIFIYLQSQTILCIVRIRMTTKTLGKVRLSHLWQLVIGIFLSFIRL